MQTSSGLIIQTDSPMLIGSIWWIWTPTFPDGWGPEKIFLLKSSNSLFKNSWFLLTPIFRFPGVIFSSILSPYLNDSIWSLRINSKSTERGAESKHEIKIDLGFWRGSAMISNGLCLMKGQHPDSNKISITVSYTHLTLPTNLCV